MRIGIVATHSWPIPTPLHTGDIVILDLAIALTELGHEVTMFAPAGTQAPGRLCEMPASLGASFPLAHQAEQQCWDEHREVILSLDVVHDFSVTKRIVECMAFEGRMNYVATPMGGQWNHPDNGRNVCVWSEAMRQRALRGDTDYVGTPTPDMAGTGYAPLREAHTVHGGIDTSFYCPDTKRPYEKEDYYLWMGRWHPVRGYKMAIDVARATGIKLVMAGEDPSYMRWEAERSWCVEAIEYAKGLANVRFEFLRPDPDHHTHKRELCRRARALLLPTQFHEPFGLTQVEAMACGTPVIANSYGSHPEVSGMTGITTTENSLRCFVDAVKEMEASVPTRLDFERCRNDAVARFSRVAMARSYLAEYEAVIRGEGWG